MDSLEHRRLLSAATFSSGTWTITGDSVADVLTIEISGTSLLAKDGGVLVSGANTEPTASVNFITINAGGGNDTITIPTGLSSINTTLNGEAGNDTITGGDGDDEINGSTENDVLQGGTGDDTLAGGTGNDTYKFAGSADLGSDDVTENSAAGTDTLDLTGLSGSDDPTIDLGDAVNRQLVLDTQSLSLKLSSSVGIENYLGSPYVDTVTGNALGNLIEGRAGTDTLDGADGNDTVDGGDGDDCVHGGIGTDLLMGGAGVDNIGVHSHYATEEDADTIYGNAGDDAALGGGDGNDVIFGDDGLQGNGCGGTGYNDDIDGGVGLDTIYGGRGNDTIDGNDSNDTIFGDYLNWETGYGAVDEGNDNIAGGTGDDTVYGDSNDISDNFGLRRRHDQGRGWLRHAVRRVEPVNLVERQRRA